MNRGIRKVLLLIFFVGIHTCVLSQKLYTRSPEGLKKLIDRKDQVIKEAEQILSSYKTLTVTDKKYFDVTDDKHDYVSMALYWWPNPLSPNGVPYIRKDGKKNPNRKKFYRDINNLAELANRVEKLGNAYYLSKDARYLKEAEKYLKVWFVDEETKMNPNFNHAQFIKGVNKGRIEGIIDAKIFIRIIEGVDFLNSDKKMDANLLSNLQTWFSDFLNWMEHSSMGEKGFSLKNNIATSFHLQRMVYYIFLDKEAKAMDIYHSDIEKLFENQIDRRGRQVLELMRTDPIGYSKANLIYLKQSVNLAENIGGRNENKKRRINKKIKRAERYIINNK